MEPSHETLAAQARLKVHSVVDWLALEYQQEVRMLAAQACTRINRSIGQQVRRERERYDQLLREVDLAGLAVAYPGIMGEWA